MKRVVVITDSEQFQRLARHAAGADTAVRVVKASAFSPATFLAQLAGPGVAETVIFGPGTPVDSALTMAAHLESHYPAVVVILAVPLEATQLLLALRAGVRDVLDPQSEVSDIRCALDRAQLGFQRTAPRAVTGSSVGARSRGRVIPVASPKGGTGKTTVATNLAVGLARLAPQQTVILDLDIQFGDVATALQLQPEHGLQHAVQASDRSDALVLKTFLTPHPAGLYALCAPESPAAGESVTGDDVARLLEVLAQEFRYVVVDTAPGLTEHTLAVLDNATDLVMVCGMDVPSVRGTRKELALLQELSLDTMTSHLVLNFADKHSGLTVTDVERVIGRKIDIVLPRSRAVPLSTNQGIPLLQSRPRDRVARGLQQLVERFQPDLRAPAARGPRHRAVAK
ncbi:MAG: AAA family ATPase [Nakamurella sp.]